MQPVGDRSDDAEISAAAAQSPEQLGVLVFGRVQQLPIRGDDLLERIAAAETGAGLVYGDCRFSGDRLETRGPSVGRACEAARRQARGGLR